MLNNVEIENLNSTFHISLTNLSLMQNFFDDDSHYNLIFSHYSYMFRTHDWIISSTGEIWNSMSCLYSLAHDVHKSLVASRNNVRINWNRLKATIPRRLEFSHKKVSIFRNELHAAVGLNLSWLLDTRLIKCDNAPRHVTCCSIAVTKHTRGPLDSLKTIEPPPLSACALPRHWLIRCRCVVIVDRWWKRNAGVDPSDQSRYITAPSPPSPFYHCITRLICNPRHIIGHVNIVDDVRKDARR